MYINSTEERKTKSKIYQFLDKTIEKHVLPFSYLEDASFQLEYNTQ